MSVALDRVTIRGFKSIRALEGFKLERLNVLVGGNGAGKSNFVEFFRLLRSLVEGRLNPYFRRGGGVGDHLFGGRKVTARMDFEMRFGVRGFKFSIVPGQGEDCVLTDEARFHGHGTSGWSQLGESPDGRSRLVHEVATGAPDAKYSKPVLDAISSWQVYHFHDTSQEAGVRQYEIVEDAKELRLDGANLAPFLLRLRTDDPKAYREIRDASRLVMPFFDDFLLDVRDFGGRQKVNLSWHQVDSDYPMQPYHLSDGSLRFVCLAAALLQPRLPATLVLDEPELGQHPSAIALLGEMITSAASRAQVVVATQSPGLVDCFGVEDVVVVDRRDGSSTFERLKEEDFRTWLEEYSLGQLWVKNIVGSGGLHA